MNKRYYTDIAKAMKEFGGCRAWEFGDQHISQRMIDLGLEEYDPQEPSKRVRKKPRTAPRRGPALGNSGNGSWNNQHHPYGAGNNNNSNNSGHTLTEEQQEHLHQMLYKPEPESPGPGASNSPSQQHPNDGIKAERDPGRADSARVAKRACEQLFNRGGSNPVYGNLPNESRHPMP